LRIVIAAVGRLRAGPEQDLVADYLARANAGARALALAPIELVEVHGKPPGDPRAEAAALYRATPDGARRVLLDERGALWSSRQLAENMALWRDGRVPALTFWIGGTDGVAQSVKDQADDRLALGRLTWPHMLARVMLAEQVYRAVTILSHAPYHRD
jgi:23S rRNA (pseudouridine1915-N3)-methyltransferase